MVMLVLTASLFALPVEGSPMSAGADLVASERRGDSGTGTARGGDSKPCKDEFRKVPAVGLACHVDDGLLKVKLGNGTAVLTHGPDLREFAATTAAIAPGVVARSPVCGGSHYYRAVVAAPSDYQWDLATEVPLYREDLRWANGVLYEGAVESGSASGAQMRFLCDPIPAPQIAVDTVKLPTHSSVDNFSTIVTDLKALGFNNANENYAVYYLGGPGLGYAGQADREWDSSDSANNRSNSGPHYALMYRWFHTYESPSYASLYAHEIGHTLGAVQNDAPYSTGQGHCYDFNSIMCQIDTGVYVINCPDYSHYDCNHDNFFDAAIGAGQGGGGGSYLDTHWNIGECYVRWVINYACVSTADSDVDGVQDALDKCPLHWNPGQEDSDGDGLGNTCDGPDGDGDGARDFMDNCLTVANPDQHDSDGDGPGDGCDPLSEDPQGDFHVPGLDISGVKAVHSPCLSVSAGFFGGIARPSANAANSVFGYVDLDADQNTATGLSPGLGSYGIDYYVDLSSEAAGAVDVESADQFGNIATVGTAPITFTSNSFTVTIPHTLIGGDGVVDYNVWIGKPLGGFPIGILQGGSPRLLFEPSDTSPLIPPATSRSAPDADGDCVANEADNCPSSPNASQADADGDGDGDSCDNCPLIANADQRNSDNDAQGDACDTDDDNDGVLDGADNCPITPSADQTDSDGDLAGDVCDGPGSGNVDCNGPINGVNAIDALKVMRHSASLPVAQNEPCADIGALIGGEQVQGDVDCSNPHAVNSIDALKILRAVSGLNVALPAGCPAVKPP
jgi:hypothetical protein